MGRPREQTPPRGSIRSTAAQLPARRGEQPQRRRGPQLRADREPGRRRAATPGSSSRAAACTATSRPSTRTGAIPRYFDLSRDADAEEALGRGDRSQRHARHRPEPPRLLPARAGAARRQLARLLGGRPVQADGTTCATGDECCGGYCEPSERRRGLQSAARSRRPASSVREVHDRRRLLRRDARASSASTRVCTQAAPQ